VQATAARPVLVLGRRTVAELLPLSACIDAVEEAFRLLGEARVPVPGTLGRPVSGGRVHVTILDSTGTAIQDVAVAALAYERAVAAGRGLPVDLAD
jgi:ornithine cyclodeaminase/alanine dehydrogenase-like protein (mu-crystallin family)